MKNFYVNNLAFARIGMVESEWFPLSNELRQGYVTAVFFDVYILWIMEGVVREVSARVRWTGLELVSESGE